MNDFYENYDPWHAEPRPDQAMRIRCASIELGKRQRQCRACKRAIPMGEYHLAIATHDTMASYKFCQDCVKNLAEWIKIYNERAHI